MLCSDVQPEDVSPEQDAINLPPALFKNEMISGYDNIGLLFTLYNSSTLFPVNAGKNLSSDQSIETVVGSRIIAATVGANLTLRNLEEQESVTIVLQLLNPEKNVSLEVFWLQLYNSDA